MIYLTLFGSPAVTLLIHLPLVSPLGCHSHLLNRPTRAIGACDLRYNERDSRLLRTSARRPCLTARSTISKRRVTARGTIGSDRRSACHSGADTLEPCLPGGDTPMGIWIQSAHPLSQPARQSRSSRQRTGCWIRRRFRASVPPARLSGTDPHAGANTLTRPCGPSVPRE